jgi:Mn2+/Fe2+ NRAMP family transporter
VSQHPTDSSPSRKSSFWRRFVILMGVVGPGLITANIDNDAGGIATYSMAGASTGMRLIWVLMPITFLLIMVQEMSARMGMASGKGLADLIREKFGVKLTFYTLFFLIFADIGNTMAEFAGIAASGEIFGVSKYISIPFSTLIIWQVILKSDYKIVERIFLAGCLVYLSYIVSGIMIAPDWSQVAKAIVIPNIQGLKSTDLPIIVGLIGTSITPWMQFYIQSAVVEKNIDIKYLWHTRIDIIVGCLFMFLVTVFIIICCAATIYKSGITINSAKDAAMALGPLAGENASILFGIGLFNASFFAAALLPLATAYYVCEGMGLEAGVDKTFKEAPNFFIIFSFILFFSAFMVLIPNINLFKILIWSQIINGIFIPIILIYIINLCNDPDVMGKYTNGRVFNILAYFLVFLMIVANGGMIYFDFIKKFI